MKYEGIKPSGKDKDIEVYLFTMGKQEIKVLNGVLSKHLMELARISPEVKSMPNVNRIRNINKKLKKALDETISNN